MGNSLIKLKNGATLIDLTADTVDSNSLKLGTTAHDKSGTEITGTLRIKDEQEKNFEAIENGSFEVLADEGKTLSKVNLNVNVQGGLSATIERL